MKYNEITDEIFNAWLQGIDIALELEDVGIYPAAINDVPRSEYGNGWNACGMAKSEKVCSFSSFRETLTTEQQKALLFLILNEDILIKNNKDNKIVLAINCSDRFYHACSDSEECQISDLESLCLLRDQFGYEGLLAWIFLKRKDCPRPCKNCVDIPKFDAAIQFLGTTK